MNVFDHLGAHDPVALLEKDRKQRPDIEQYLGHLMMRYASEKWMDILTDLAYFIQPVDRVLGIDEEFMIGNAFLRGSILGLHVVTQCLPPEVKQNMPRVHLASPPDTTDPQQARFEISASIMDAGDRGFGLYPRLSNLIESWENEIIPAPQSQIFVRRGFGVMMYAMTEAGELLAREHIAEGVRQGVDWDSELRDLLNNPSQE